MKFPSAKFSTWNWCSRNSPKAFKGKSKRNTRMQCRWIKRIKGTHRGRIPLSNLKNNFPWLSFYNHHWLYSTNEYLNVISPRLFLFFRLHLSHVCGSAERWKTVANVKRERVRVSLCRGFGPLSVESISSHSFISFYCRNILRCGCGGIKTFYFISFQIRIYSKNKFFQPMIIECEAGVRFCGTLEPIIGRPSFGTFPHNAHHQ